MRFRLRLPAATWTTTIVRSSPDRSSGAASRNTRATSSSASALLYVLGFTDSAVVVEAGLSGGAPTPTSQRIRGGSLRGHGHLLRCRSIVNLDSGTGVASRQHAWTVTYVCDHRHPPGQYLN